MIGVGGDLRTREHSEIEEQKNEALRIFKEELIPSLKKDTDLCIEEVGPKYNPCKAGVVQKEAVNDSDFPKGIFIDNGKRFEAASAYSMYHQILFYSPSGKYKIRADYTKINPEYLDMSGNDREKALEAAQYDRLRHKEFARSAFDDNNKEKLT